MARRAPELSEVVWQHALAIVERSDAGDPVRIALELLRAAHADPSVMAHALALGQSQLRADIDDPGARAAARVLEDAIDFLGGKPEANDIASGNELIEFPKRHMADAPTPRTAPGAERRGQTKGRSLTERLADAARDRQAPPSHD